MTSYTRLGLALSVCVILAAHVEPAAWEPDPDWTRVAWIPFVSPPVRLFDIAFNVLLFVPFGYFFAAFYGKLSPAVRASAALLGALALSTLLEVLQLFMPDRFPSTTDIASNVTGAAIGTIMLLLETPAPIREP